ncbi:MAG: class I SAM-dependent methyltransferase [Rhodothermia bacterium]|nr:class I SAM-dependent methyltransferase [Rhodothermia bacterium]
MTGIRTLSHRVGFRLAGRLAVRRGKPIDEVDAAVRKALDRAIRGELDPGEAYWTETIESARRKMLRDTTTVTYTDYGTGNGRATERPTVTRTLREVVSYSVPRHEGLALFNLVRALRPTQCLELGTCVGISAAYIAAAIDLNESGRLTTMEGGKDLARVASINFTRMNLGNVTLVSGSFQEMVPEVLPTLKPIDFAYIDGHHDGGATREYFRQIADKASPHAVVVLDDIRWSRDMHSAWKSIVADPAVVASYDLLVCGVCLIRRSRNGEVA